MQNLQFSNFKFQIKNKGFTLIEVVVVIAIIGVLIAFSAVAYQSARAAGRDTKRKGDLYDVRSALEIYRTDCGQYPASLNFGGSLTGTGSCAGNTYISSVPSDPLGSGGRQYRYSGSANTYELCASMEQGSGTQNCGGSSVCGNSTCNFKVTNP
ncbi:MAG: prepilin-type N-terminal cleavage/methylation domain-containing protein [Candidatus Blackburnbacteria bacterium]|nr:prepilin-type N-terminal cleavage/methylation domain-containing protein [Candidatus Blackburnbacteria bacterium]